MPERRVLARLPEQTEALGAALARAMPRPLHGPAVLYLEGELGAGKTTLARGFLRGCGFTGPVRSPTFALLETYALGDLVVVHVDLYRLAGPRELEALGLRDFASSGHVWLIEWPVRGAGALVPPDLTIELTVPASGPGREILAASHTPSGAGWIEGTVEFSGNPT